MTVLVGGTALGTNGEDFEATGFTIASKRTAVASGTVTQVQARTGPTTASAATSLVAAIYADSAGTPGARIGVNSTALTTGLTSTGVWLVFTGLSSAVTSGTVYWIAIGVTGGNFRFSLNDATTVAGSKDCNSNPPPATWSTTVGTYQEIANFYAEDTTGATEFPPPILLMAPPLPVA